MCRLSSWGEGGWGARGEEVVELIYKRKSLSWIIWQTIFKHFNGENILKCLISIFYMVEKDNSLVWFIFLFV